MRLWYLRRGVPWVAVAGCLAVAAALAAAAHHWTSAALVLLPFAVASGAAAAGFLLDEEGAALLSSTPRGGRWAEATRLAALPGVGVAVLVLVRPVADAAGLTPVGWSVVPLVGVALGASAARVLRPRFASPGSHVAVLLVLTTALPFTIGALLGWTPPWPADELSGGVAGLWAALGAAALLVLVGSLLHAEPRTRRRSASMAP